MAIIILLTACHSYNKQLKTVVENADSIAINYYRGNGTDDTVMSVIIIRDEQQIDQLVRYVSEDGPVGPDSCGVDGAIYFFKNDSVVQRVDFALSRSTCNYFSYEQNGKNVCTLYSDSAKTLLARLSLGKSK
jgi:hypothetical protein